MSPSSLKHALSKLGYFRGLVSHQKYCSLADPLIHWAEQHGATLCLTHANWRGFFFLVNTICTDTEMLRRLSFTVMREMSCLFSFIFVWNIKEQECLYVADIKFISDKCYFFCCCNAFLMGTRHRDLQSVFHSVAPPNSTAHPQWHQHPSKEVNSLPRTTSPALLPKPPLSHPPVTDDSKFPSMYIEIPSRGPWYTNTPWNQMAEGTEYVYA